MVSSAPDASAAPGRRRIVAEDALVLAALALLWALAAAWTVAGAGLGMDAWDMTRMAWLPQHHAAPRGDMAAMDMGYLGAARGAGYWALTVAMWWTMMVAMMLPSAAPAVRLYARVHRHAATRGGGTAPVAAFVAGYALAWGAFALAATAVQAALAAAGGLAPMTLGIPQAWLAGVVLIAAGAYQFTPYQRACLAHCRAPAAFLSRHWRPGAAGALRLGARHGVFCLGCCAGLMALLFVGGVMNLAWIAALALLVLAEQRLPGGRAIGRVAGLVLVAWGVALLLR
jgi:predicted metal-binding membrane protein